MEGRSQVSVIANMSILLSLARIDRERILFAKLLRFTRQTLNLLNLELTTEVELFTHVEKDLTRLTIG